jgi:hypothetical protein
LTLIQLQSFEAPRPKSMTSVSDREFRLRGSTAQRRIH